MSNTLTLPKDTTDLVEALTGQPELFSILEVNADVVRAARDFVHTGTTVSRDAQSVVHILAGASLGWSERRIAEQTHHSRNTVRAVLRLAEKNGKVEPVKERVLAAMAEAVHSDVELGNELADRARESKSLEVVQTLAQLRRSTWVGGGILADKDVRPASGSGPAPSGVNVQVNLVVQEYARRLADCQSGGLGVKGQQSQGMTVEVMPVVMPIDPETTTVPAEGQVGEGGGDRGGE